MSQELEPIDRVNAKAWERESRQWQLRACEAEKERDLALAAKSALLSMVKMCYRKHVLGDDNIGWTQLEVYLLHALCNEMGDEGFRKWAEAAKENL